MRKNLKGSAAVVIVATLVAGGALVAQGVLLQLGLAEAGARKFLLDEWTRPGNGMGTVSRLPILLWIDGLDQS